MRFIIFKPYIFKLYKLIYNYEYVDQMVAGIQAWFVFKYSNFSRLFLDEIMRSLTKFRDLVTDR